MRRPLLLLVLPVVLVVGAMTPAVPATAAPAAAPPAYTVRTETPRGQAAVQQVTAVLIAPAGTTRDYTRDDVIRTLGQVDAYYANETNGFIRVQTVAVSDWVEPDDADLDCADYAAVDAVAVRYAGWIPGPNRHLLALVPDGGQCGGSSNASQGDGMNSGGMVYIANMTPAIIAHELGHNLSLSHASSVQCSTGWDFDATRGLPSACTRLEYGNESDLMGSSYAFYSFSAPSLDRLGLISHEAVPTCGGARRIPIRTMSAGFGAQRIVSWADPRKPSVRYFVQYRDAADRSEYDAVWASPNAIDRESGVQVLRTDPAASTGGSILVRPGDASASKQLLHAGDRVQLADGMSVAVAGLDEVGHVATVDVTVPCAAAPAAAAGQGVDGSAALSAVPDAAVSDRVR
jgi:hypothetical protein